MTDQTTRQTVEYFLQSREAGEDWEDSSAFSNDYAWAAERLAKRQNLVAGFEYRIARRTTTVVVEPADAAASEVEPAPSERGELWSLLDWTFWGSGMGDVFREPLADTMLAAVTPEQLAQAEQLMQAWHDSGRQPIGRRRYEELNEELKAAHNRIQSLTEAVILWRDRPGGDIGLALALANILDTEQPDPPAATALVRVLRECDRIERAVRDNPTSPDLEGGYLACLRHIREAAAGMQEGTE